MLRPRVRGINRNAIANRRQCIRTIHVTCIRSIDDAAKPPSENTDPNNEDNRDSIPKETEETTPNREVQIDPPKTQGSSSEDVLSKLEDLSKIPPHPSTQPSQPAKNSARQK